MNKERGFHTQEISPTYRETECHNMVTYFIKW